MGVRVCCDVCLCVCVCVCVCVWWVEEDRVVHHNPSARLFVVIAVVVVGGVMHISLLRMSTCTW